MSWLYEVGKFTAEHREERAKAILYRGRRRKWNLREQLWSENYVRDALRWYESRARGQRERIARVRDCGAEVLTFTFTCASCGAIHERATGCRVGSLCEMSRN